MEDMEKDMDELYWSVINALAVALNEQKETGKYDEESLRNVVDELDLECDRRIVFGEPTEPVVELREALGNFVHEEE